MLYAIAMGQIIIVSVIEDMSNRCSRFVSRCQITLTDVSAFDKYAIERRQTCTSARHTLQQLTQHHRSVDDTYLQTGALRRL